MKVKHEARYKHIAKKHKETGHPLYKLCKEAGVSYQAYHNWEKKQAGGAAWVEIPGEVNPLKEIITLQIPVMKLIAVMKAGRDLTLSLREIFPMLTDQQRKVIYEVKGRLELERMIEQKEDSEPSSWEPPTEGLSGPPSGSRKGYVVRDSD